MKYKLTLIALSLLLCMSILLPGCSQATISPATTKAPTPSLAPVATGVPSTIATVSKTRKITDASGRVVEIPAVVTRVADLWPANNGMVLLLGGGDKLVATVQQAQNQPWIKKLLPKIASLPSVVNASNDLNVEALVNTNPDVILMSYVGGMPTWMDKAAAAKIPVVLMPGNTFEDIKTAIRMTGEVLGPAEAAVAEEWVKYYDGNVKKIAAVTALVPEDQRPRVLHTLRPTILSVDGIGGLVNDWIKNSGGVNVAVDVKGNSGTVTMEQIIKWNPEVIICGTEPNTENAQKILTDPQWANIKAVKDKKVYVNPTGVYLWDRHSGEGALQILWAAKLLYPDKFKDIDLKAETKTFFTKFFHYNLTDADYDSIMNAKAP